MAKNLNRGSKSPNMRSHPSVISTAFFALVVLAAAYVNAAPPPPPPPPLDPGTTVSVSSSGVAGDDDSTDGFVSPDGSKVAFSSFATNFDSRTVSLPGPQVFVRNLSVDTTQWASLGALSVANAEAAMSPVLSDTGQFLSFTQQFGSPTSYSIILRDLDDFPNYETIISSASPVSDSSMSTDARYVAFSADEALLPEDTDALSDIYIRDRQTGTLLFRSGLALTGESAFRPVLSGDGQVVAFEAATVPLTPFILITDIQFGVFLLGQEPSLTDDGSHVAFRRNRGGVDRILVEEPLGVTATQEASIDTSGNPTTGDCDSPVISANGQFVAFRCVTALTDHAALDQVYVRDLVAGTTKLASLSETGVPANSTDSKPVSITANGDAVIIESSADSLGSVPGGFSQLFRVESSLWEETSG